MRLEESTRDTYVSLVTACVFADLTSFPTGSDFSYCLVRINVPMDWLPFTGGIRL